MVCTCGKVIVGAPSACGKPFGNCEKSRFFGWSYPHFPQNRLWKTIQNMLSVHK